MSKIQRIVKSELTKNICGDVNIPIKPELFKHMKYAETLLLKPQEKFIYRIVGYAGWDKPYQQIAIVYCISSIIYEEYVSGD